MPSGMCPWRRGETWSDRWVYLQISYYFFKKCLFSPIYIICEIIYREAQARSEASPKPWVSKWSSWGSLNMSALWAWAVCWEKKAKWPQSTGIEVKTVYKRLHFLLRVRRTIYTKQGCLLQNVGDTARAVLRAVELQGRQAGSSVYGLAPRGPQWGQGKGQWLISRRRQKLGFTFWSRSSFPLVSGLLPNGLL